MQIYDKVKNEQEHLKTSFQTRLINEYKIQITDKSKNHHSHENNFLLFNVFLVRHKHNFLTDNQSGN